MNVETIRQLYCSCVCNDICLHQISMKQEMSPRTGVRYWGVFIIAVSCGGDMIGKTFKGLSYSINRIALYSPNNSPIEEENPSVW